MSLLPILWQVEFVQVQESDLFFINEVYGVLKAYTSRVGAGPFPTEQNNEIGDRIRELGWEYGTTTGRPRRCGWLDLVMIKYAARVNGLTALAINHVDTIGKLPKIKLCVAYKKETGRKRAISRAA